MLSRDCLGLVLSSHRNRLIGGPAIRMLRGHGLQHVPRPSEASQGREKKETRGRSSSGTQLNSGVL